MRRSKLISVSFDKFKSRKIRYLFAPFFPRGMVSLLAGEGGMGKSTLTTYLTKCVTLGKPWAKIGDIEPTKPTKGSVIFLCKEESAELSIKPRLEAAGVDVTRVHTIGIYNGLEVEDFEVVESLDGVATALGEIIDQIGDVQMVVADPLPDFIGDLSMYSEKDIRKFITPINKLCARRNIAFIGIMHMNKDVKKEPKHRMMGGAGFYNAARAVNYLGQGQDKTRYLMMGKANNQGKFRNIAFNIVSDDNGRPVIEWHPDWEENLDIKEILAGQHSETSKFNMAKGMIEGWLAAGAVPAAEIEERIESALIGRSTIIKAKKVLGVMSVKPDGVWYWALPGKEEPRVEDETAASPKTGGRAKVGKSRNGGRAKARDLVVSGGRPKIGLLN